MNSLKKTAGFAALLVVVQLATHASDTDTGRIEHLSMWRQTDVQARLNPAFHGISYKNSYSELQLSTELHKESKAFVIELGDGHFLPEIKVSSFLHLSPNTSVWGAASYMTGQQKNVKWNSTTDYELLNPYILADTLGGDTHRERYAFTGGFSTLVKHVRFGAEATFRAEHEYRDTDPRMRGIVNELTMRAGVTRQALHYHWGASVEGMLYKQTNDVAFYKETGVIPEFQMTGLGTEYSRFSGDRRTLYYQGSGGDVRLLVNPASDKGFFGNISLETKNYKRVIASLNSMPLTQLYYNTTRGQLGWKRKGKRHLMLAACATYTKRNGDEFIIGESTSQAFPAIGKLTMYKNSMLNAGLQAIYGTVGISSQWHARVDASYVTDLEKYVYPLRQLNHSGIWAEVTGQYIKNFSNALSLTIDGGATALFNVDDKLIMPFANIDAVTTQMIIHKYLFEKANYATLHAQARLDKRLKATKIGFFGELGGRYIHCAEHAHGYDLHAAIGLTF